MIGRHRAARKVALRRRWCRRSRSALASSCAVGPNFEPPPAPDVAGYVAGELASPDAEPGAARAAAAFRHRRRRFGALVGGVPLPAAQRADQAFGRPQSILQAAEAAIRVAQYQCAGAARTVLSANRRELHAVRAACFPTQVGAADPGASHRRPSTRCDTTS